MSIVTCQKPPLYRRRHEGCAEELASLTAALSVGRVACRGGGMIDGVGIRRGRVMHTAVASSMRSQPGGRQRPLGVFQAKRVCVRWMDGIRRGAWAWKLKNNAGE